MLLVPIALNTVTEGINVEVCHGVWLHNVASAHACALLVLRVNLHRTAKH